MKKTIIIIVSIIIVVVLAIFIGKRIASGHEKKIYYWRTSPVEKGDVNVVVTATGTLAADTTVQVGTEVTGVLEKQYVDFNSTVKKGQIIALIDTSQLYPAMLDAKAQWERAQAQRDEYKRELDRAKIMLENKVEAQQDYDIALTNYQTQVATLDQLEADYKRALVNLHYAIIRAPVNGVVISRNYDVGIMVIASFSTPTLFTIANDLTKMQVQANVDEADIGRIKEGESANFTVDAYSDTVFTGTVTQIRRNPVTIQNVVNYVVIIESPNPDLKLIPGLTANININVQTHKNILKVPSNALSFVPPTDYLETATGIADSIKRKVEVQSQQVANKIIPSTQELAKTYLWVERGNDIYAVAVVKGLSDGIFTEVSGDLKVGDNIVTGINSTEAAQQANAPSGQQNPFMPKFPTHKK
jgi:HlyD family secretion protein